MSYLNAFHYFCLKYVQLLLRSQFISTYKQFILEVVIKLIVQMIQLGAQFSKNSKSFSLKMSKVIIRFQIHTTYQKDQTFFMTNETNTRNLTLAQLLWEKVFLGKVHLVCKFTVKGLIIYFQLLIYDMDNSSSSKKLKCFP